jgi:hypothetical protein
VVGGRLTFGEREEIAWRRDRKEAVRAIARDRQVPVDGVAGAAAEHLGVAAAVPGVPGAYPGQGAGAPVPAQDLADALRAADVIILGERHLALVPSEYVTHYNGHRPHQSRQRQPPDIETQPARDVADLRSVRRKRVVAGVVNEYHRAA